MLTIAGVICIYSLTEFCGGNGFLSVYLAGLTMGGEKYFSKKTLGVFHDGLAWLMQVAMFLTMGLLVFPSAITEIMDVGIMLALGLLFLARPLSVYLCLCRFKYTPREIIFVSWGGLRGAVPIILATYLLVSNVPNAQAMFNTVFFTVILSMLIQGTSLDAMARWMKVQEPIRPKRRLPFKSRLQQKEFVEFEVGIGSPLLGKKILELDFPIDLLVVLIHRQENDFIPRGNTEIELYDQLVCLVNINDLVELNHILELKQAPSA